MHGTLTNKQMWRRQPITGIKRNSHDFLYKEGVNNSGVSITKSISDSSSNKPPMINNTFSKPYATTGSLSEKHKLNSSLKKVRFNPAVRVVLIPTVTEYRLVGLGDDMWWNDLDYKDFKNSALNELKLFMLMNTSMDSKSAIHALYQPDLLTDNISYDFSSSSVLNKKEKASLSKEKELCQNSCKSNESFDLMTSQSNISKSEAAETLTAETTLYNSSNHSISRAHNESMKVVDDVAVKSQCPRVIRSDASTEADSRNNRNTAADEPMRVSPTSSSQGKSDKSRDQGVSESKGECSGADSPLYRSSAVLLLSSVSSVTKESNSKDRVGSTLSTSQAIAPLALICS